MTKEQFGRIVKNNVVVAGGVKREAGDTAAMLEERLRDIVEGGANIVLAPTDGLDGMRLAAEEVGPRNVELAAAAMRAAGDDAFVAGVLSGGVTVRPFGEHAFDACVAGYRAQAQALLDAGVSLFYLGGFTDIFSARCALIAVKDICTLPVCVGLRFESDGAGKLSLNYGTDPVCALVTLQSLGADAVGCCNADCDDVLDALLTMRDFCTVPLLALPRLDGPGTLPAHIFAEYVPSFVNNKCAVVGLSQCAVGAEAYVAQVCKQTWQLVPFVPDFPRINAVSSYCDVLFMDYSGKPVGRDDTLYLKLDRHSKNIEQVVETMVTKSTLPAWFEIDDEQVLERVLRLYPGRCGVTVPDDLLWLVEEYGEPFVVVQPEERDA